MYKFIQKLTIASVFTLLLCQTSYATKCSCVCDFGEFDQEDTAVTIITGTNMCSELNTLDCDENGLNEEGSGSLKNCKKQKIQVVN